MTAPALPVEAIQERISGEILRGAAEIWRRQQREFVTAFDGVSMQPTISPGQSVTVRCGVEANVNDVAVSLREDQLIVHRVVWKSRDGRWLVTCGDARTIPDLPMDSSDILGVVQSIQTETGWLPVSAERPGGRKAVSMSLVFQACHFGRRAASVAVRSLQITAHLVARGRASHRPPQR